MEQDHNVHLKWNTHQDTLTSVFVTLLESEKLVDCVVSAEGQCLNVHKIVLSACSQYFELLFSQHYERYPIIVLSDVKFHVLKALMYFMYCGEVSIPKDDLDMLLRLAEFLQVKGLSTTVGVNAGSNLVSERKNDTSLDTHSVPFQPVSPSGFSSDSLQEIQRDQAKKISGGNPPRLYFQKKLCTDVSAVHRQKQSDQCSVSSYRTQRGSLTMKKGNACRPASSCSFTGFAVTKIEPHDNTSEMSSSPYSTTSRCNYTQPVEKVAGNDPRVLDTEFPIPLSAMPTEAAEDEDVFDPGVPTGVAQQSKCEDFEDDMEVIALDDQDESGSGVSGVEKMTSKRQFLDSETPNHELQCGQAKDGSALAQQPTTVAHDQSNPCKCHVCGKIYQHYSSLKRHTKYECGKEPQFKCPHCQSRYTQKCHLRRHMLDRHQIY